MTSSIWLIPFIKNLPVRGGACPRSGTRLIYFCTSIAFEHGIDLLLKQTGGITNEAYPRCHLPCCHRTHRLISTFVEDSLRSNSFYASSAQYMWNLDCRIQPESGDWLKLFERCCGGRAGHYLGRWVLWKRQR